MSKCVNQVQSACSLHFAWHSAAVLVNLSWPTMLFSESSQAASSKAEQSESNTSVVVEEVVVGCVVVDCVVDFVVVVVSGAGPGGQEHPEKSGLVGPLTHPPQCSVWPHSFNK